MRAKTTQEADGSWCRVKLRQFAIVHSLPVTRRRGVDGGRFKNGSSDAVCERTINNITRAGSLKGEKGKTQKYVRVSGDPTNIGHASKPVIRVEVEDVFYGQGCTEQVSTCRVHDALWFAS